MKQKFDVLNLLSSEKTADHTSAIQFKSGIQPAEYQLLHARWRNPNTNRQLCRCN